MKISLIANTGIQFYKFQLNIDLNEDVISSLAFYEYFDDVNIEISLEYAYKIPDTDIYTPKSILVLEDYLDENNKFKTDVNPNTVPNLPKMQKDPPVQSGYYKVNDIETCLERYENTWLPFPYFKRSQDKKSQFGPLAWSRILLKNITDKNTPKGMKSYQVVLAFDTTIANDPDLPYFTPREDDTKAPYNIFGTCNNEDFIANFCNEQYNCGWVNDYLREICIDGELPEVFAMKHVAEYVYLVNYLNGLENFYLQKRLDCQLSYQKAKNPEKKQQLAEELNQINQKIEKEIFPEMVFYSNEKTPVEVDLVLDIGNSNTCGLLFESPADTTKKFNFNSVKKLELTDLSDDFGKIYGDPFSMRLAFAKVSLGNIDIPEYQKVFKWPSLVRVGKEAQRLINQYNIDIDRGMETATNNSSPKRYLWDNKKSSVPWEFVNFLKRNQKDDEEELVITPYQINELAYQEGVSEQFKGDGEYTFDTNSAIKPYYSRKSLMTFVYIEVFLHALSQINSFKFRSDNDGPTEKIRKLRRITITCPTSIVQEEQIILRQCAVEAARTIKRFYDDTYNQQVDPEELQIDFKIIPEPKELSRDLAEIRAGEKKDWIYDEATCNQLVFLYAEISARYLNECEEFFNLYGKRRNDVDESYQNSITIGSIDIGGGTTDLMIAAYEYADEQSKAVIRPKPLYWESFTLAGDDLLKELVKQIILEGMINQDDEKGSKGVIKNYAIEQGCKNVTAKMQNFFGTDTNKMNYMKRVYRKNFNVQIAIPIALKYLEHAGSDSQDKHITFEEIFSELKPNPELIKFLNEHLNDNGSEPAGTFDFEMIKWRLRKKTTFEIIEKTFDRLFKQISMLMASYGCDFILLSGKITSVPKIREMFVKYHPAPPDRIVSLDSYRVGRWYPDFGEKADKSDLGYFNDTKTIVAVGATIALMGGKLDKLGDFRIDTEYLIKDLVSTCDYIGGFDRYTKDVKFIYLSPDENKNTVELSGLPIILGYKQLPSETYPGRPIFKLDFNEDFLRKKIEQLGLDFAEPEMVEAIEEEKNKIKRKMPLKIRFTRDKNNKENIEIASIKDRSRDELSEQTLKLSLMTLPEETGYWLDTGEFILNIERQ